MSDSTDFVAALDAAFDRLGTGPAARPATFGGAAARDGGDTPTPLRLAVANATFAVRKAAVRRPWAEALHPRGHNIPDIRGRINRGEFGNKPTAAKAPKARRAAQPAAAKKSPMSGVSHSAHAKAREHAQREVEKARARGHRHLQRFADRAEDNMRATIASLKAAGHSPLKGTLAEHEAWLYAVAVLRARLSRAALAGLAGRAAPPAGGGEVRQPVERGPVPKVVERLQRFTSAAVRRRVLHGLRNERLLAEALGALNLPDSEAADVVLVVGPTGELVTDHKAVLSFLRVREDAVRRASRMTPEERTAAGLDAVLSAPVHFFEVKTLRTSARNRIQMSRHAAGRKRGWERRFAGTFWTVIMDDRKGAKYSGNRLYLRKGVGNTALSQAAPVGDFSDLLGEVGKEA
jgi:hypothetical protein